VERRIALRGAALGAAGGLAVAAAVGLAGLDRWWVGLGVALIGILISLLIHRTRNTPPALLIERRAPASRNLLITAHELATSPKQGYVPSLVFSEATRLVERLDPAEFFPARNALGALAAATAVWLLIITRHALPVNVPGLNSPMSSSAAPAVQSFSVTVTPPPYTGRKAETFRDPSRIEALAGSRITFGIRANADRLALETLDSRDTLAATDGRFSPVLTATADGFISVQPLAGVRAGTRRLIGLTVLPDAAPQVKITAPGHDLLLPDGKRSIALSIDAEDDIGLASLKLRYTKVSGSGERFTFTEGEVPLSLSRTDARRWKAAATWKLDPLALDAGDMVVYRAVVADARPGVPPIESDAFIAEIASPGGEAAPGFAVDPEQDRYAVSQQMVILKTERLIAKRASLSTEDFQNESAQIAAEQRKVRAEFVFMLGGELADDPSLSASMTDLNEEAEAEGEADLLAGRAANAGHIALLRAIRAMSRAAASLTTNEPTTALPYERTALTALESAFSRARILLRALTTRERLDLSRRMTGSLTDAVRDIRPRAEPQLDSRTTALRRVLAEIAAGPSSAQASELAERVLRIDASSKAMQGVADQLNRAAGALSSNLGEDAKKSLDQAATALAAELRSGLPASPHEAAGAADARLNGALADALRRNAGARP
jgi:hypothetical protein